jgi:Beta propeller domain
MTNDNKSVETEEHSMENVSIDDIEQQKQNIDSITTGRTHGTRNIILAVVITALVVGGIAGLVVGLTNTTTKESTTNGAQALEVGVPVEDSVPVDVDGLHTPFGDVSLPGFSPDIFQGYASVEEFQADLTKAAEFIAHNVILWNIHHYNQNAAHDDDDDVANLEAAVAASVASATKKADSKAKKLSTHKNQEADAEEADMIKADGNFVYTSHGDRLSVLDHGGNMVTQVKASCQRTEWGCDPTYIRVVLLTEDHVVLISEGYVYIDSQVGPDGEYMDPYLNFGVFDGSVTHLTVYTKPTIEKPSMKKIGTKHFNGYYQDGRWMQDSNSIQILTAGNMQVYNFVDQLSPTYFPWMSQEDYIKKSAARASKKLIPAFVAAVTRDLVVDGKVPRMLRLNAWAKEDQTDVWKHFGEYFPIEQFLSGYAQVTSFAVSDLISGVVNPSTAFFFSPQPYATLYGTDDSLLVALPRSTWDEETQTSDDSVFLLSMNIVDDGAATEFHSAGMLEGSLLSRYSLDIQGKDLRVATTIRHWSALDNVMTSCGDNYMIYNDTCWTDSLWQQCMDIALECPRGKVVLTDCPYTISCNATEEEDFSSSENYITVFDIEQVGDMVEIGRLRIGEPHEVITAVRFYDNVGYAMTFDQTDPFYVLKLEEGQPPVVSGTVTLHGFSNFLEMIDDKTMIGIGQNTTGAGLDQVTSGTMINVFDVTDPTKPVVVSSYTLEPEVYTEALAEPKAVTYADGKLIVPASVYSYNYYYDSYSIGNDTALPAENTDNNMMTTDDGMMMHTQIPGMYGSVASSGDTFEGFVVYDVLAAVGIKELFRVNHTRPAGSCSWCNAGYYTEPRSFLYEDGSLVTARGQYIIATNMTTGEQIWKLEPHSEGDTKDCCW